MKVVDLVNSKDSIEVLIGEKLPINTAYKLSRVAKEVSDILEAFNTKRSEILEGRSTEDADGNLSVIGGMEEEVIKLMDEALREEIDFEPDKFTIEQLGDIKIASRHLVLLGWLIKA